jgi:hypothetical protein
LHLKACNNLIVLAREEAGAKIICELSGVDKLLQLLVEKDPEINQTAIRTLSCLAANSQERVRLTICDVTIQDVAEVLDI